MVKRLVVAVVGLVGVVVIALGVASATLWRADDVLVAELRAGEPLVVTEPGVLELAADEVTVRAEADGPVVLAVGRDTDVTGWVGEDPHQRVTGLAGWHVLAAQDVAAPTPTATPEEEPADGEAAEGEEPAAEEPAAEEPAAEGEAAVEDDAATVPDPSGSDLWIAEQRGDGEAQITWTAQPGRWSVLAASTDGTPLRVSLAWPQVVTTPWLWPAVVVGSLLVLVAAVLLLRDVLRSRRGKDAGWTPVVTGPLPVVDATGAPVQLTRRQLRELAAHGAVPGAEVRAPREDGAHEGASPGAPGQPAPVGAASAGSSAPAATDDEAQGAPATTGPGGVRGAFASVAPATRRALRSVRSRGSGDEGTPDAPAAPAPASAAVAAERADRPAWRPTTAPSTPAPSTPAPSAAPSPGSPVQPSRDDAPTTAVPAASAGWTPASAGSGPTGTGAGPAPTTPVPAPTSRPGGSPRWSVSGGASPWTPGPPAPPAPSSTAAAPASSAPGDPGSPVGGGARGASGHPHGRPAWLGPATGATPAVPGAGHPLPPPGAPGSPDAPRRPAAHGASSPDGGRNPAAPGTGSGGSRPGWAAPPAPGAPTGRSTGPDAPRRPETPRPSPSQAAPGAPSARTGGPDAPRPAWLRDAPVPSGPRSGAATEPGGSRADAWRRAWGLPPTDDDTGSQEER